MHVQISKNIKKLAEMKHLKNLEVQVADNFDYSIFEELTSDAFASLEGFTLVDSSDSSSEIDFSGLGPLPNMKSFHLCTSRKVKSLDFSKYENIELLVIPLESFDDFSFLEKAKNLRNLNLTLPNWILNGTEELLCKAAENVQKNPESDFIHSTIWMNGCPYDLQEIAAIEREKLKEDSTSFEKRYN